MKSGFVTIVGRPNVGKSTLLNKIINKKVAITSSKVGTTRNIIEGIYNDCDTQIIFVDTPGIHKAENKLGNLLNKKAYTMSDENDLVLFIIDESKGYGKGDQFILDRLKDSSKDVILLLNKVDLVNKEKLIKDINELKDLYDFKEIIPISSLKGINIEELIKCIKKYLKDDIKYYDDDVYTNVSEKFMIAETIREKVLRLTKEEIPHAVTCMVESMEVKKNVIHINAVIIVERDSIKKIIIGKNGEMIKKIGMYAREDLEAEFNKKFYIELFVKTIENWRDKEKYLKELGFNELDD